MAASLKRITRSVTSTTSVEVERAGFDDTDFDERASTEGQAPRKKLKSDNSTDQEPEYRYSIGAEKMIKVSNFRDQTLIHIRQYYTDKTTGEEKPTKKGIALKPEQWEQLKALVPTVDEAIELCRNDSA